MTTKNKDENEKPPENGKPPENNSPSNEPDIEDEELGEAEADLENAEKSSDEPWLVKNILNPLTESLTKISEQLDSHQSRLDLIQEAMKGTAGEGSSIQHNLTGEPEPPTNSRETNKETSNSEKTETPNESREESPDKEPAKEAQKPPENPPENQGPKKRTIIRL